MEMSRDAGSIPAASTNKACESNRKPCSFLDLQRSAPPGFWWSEWLSGRMDNRRRFGYIESRWRPASYALPPTAVGPAVTGLPRTWNLKSLVRKRLVAPPEQPHLHLVLPNAPEES